LHRLPRRAFTKIVEARHDHKPPGFFVERKSNVAEICVRHVLQLGEATCRKQPHHRARRIERAIKCLDFLGAVRRLQPNVQRRENPALKRQQVGRENKIVRSETEVLGHFRRVPVGKEAVGAKIFVYFHKMRLALRFLPRAAHARLAVAHDPAHRIDPARIDVRGSVAVGRDVLLDVNVVLEGPVQLADGVHVGPNCVLRNVAIGARTVLYSNCVLHDAQIGSDCQIGPFTRMRPKVRIANGVHLGNFVEIKNSEIGAGSKVNHLSYVGDSQVGSAVNIGAGSITCNYDGANKWRTEIGDGAFIGSGAMLVAPVKIGDGATIGAGSTITSDAPDQIRILHVPTDPPERGSPVLKKVAAVYTGNGRSGSCAALGHSGIVIAMTFLHAAGCTPGPPRHARCALEFTR